MLNEKQIKKVFSADEVIRLNAGHSFAEKFVVKKGGARYFVKAFNEAIDSNLLRTLYSKLCDLGIATPKCFAIESCDDYTCIMFEYIEGVNFDELNFFDVDRVADQVVASLKKMELLEVDVPRESIEEIYNACLDDIDFYFANRENPFNFTEEHIKARFLEYKASFDGAEIKLIHGDIKPENIIVTAQEAFLADFSDVKYSYFVQNFEYTAQMFFFSNEKCQRFLKRVVTSYYGDKVPAYFYSNLKFILIKKFFNRAVMCIQNKQDDKEAWLVSEFQNIFQKIFEK